MLLPIGYVDLCVNMLWQTDCTSLCGSSGFMLFLLAFMVVKYGVLNSCRQSESPCSTSSLSTLWLHFLKDTLSVKWSPTNWAVLWECGQEYCNCTGSSQLSSFQIVYLISIVPYCGGGSRLISIYSLVRVPVGLLNYRSLSSTAWMWVKYMSCSNWVGFAQTLKVEAAAWLEGGSRVCDQCPGED